MGEQEPEVDDVRRRLEQIKRRHRGGIKWQITRHTAEMTIAAIERRAREVVRGPAPKAKRRKRHKRLL